MKNVFLFGAGFSYQFGMPLASDLTKIFLSLFNEKNISVLINGLSSQKPYGEEYPISKDALKRAFDILLKYKNDPECNNYELVISEIYQLTKEYKYREDSNSYHLVYGYLYGIIHEILVLYQKFTFPLYQQNKEEYRRFSHLLSKDKETWVFTLNHDLYMEFLAKDFLIPITFGDTKKISFRKDNIVNKEKIINFSYSERKEISLKNKQYFQDEYGINLVKLHGGLNELHYKDSSLICNLDLDVADSSEMLKNFSDMMGMKNFAPDGRAFHSDMDWFITNMEYEGDIATKSMLTGSNKYSLTYSDKENEEKLSLFSQVLKESDKLTIIGYGFNDEHVNNKIIRATILNEKLKIKIVDPSEGFPKPLIPIDEGDRVRKAQCDVANWIYHEEHSTPTLHAWNQELQKYNDNNLKMREVINKVIFDYFEAYRNIT